MFGKSGPAAGVVVGHTSYYQDSQTTEDTNRLLGCEVSSQVLRGVIVTDWDTNNKGLTIKIVWEPESTEIYTSCSPYPLYSLNLRMKVEISNM